MQFKSHQTLISCVSDDPETVHATYQVVCEETAAKMAPWAMLPDLLHCGLTSHRQEVDSSDNNITLRREVVDKILIDIPAVLTLTVQGAMALGMFLLATLLERSNITWLFAVYIVFWSLQYTSAFRCYLNDRQDSRTERRPQIE